MAIAQPTTTAFRTGITLTPEVLSADRYYWDNVLKYIMPEHYYSISKTFLINSIINNYKKQSITNLKFETVFKSYRRIDTPDTIANWIKTRTVNNQIHFISKTSISGRQISTIAEDINNTEHLTFTEDVTTSLYLQSDKNHPIRVFKFTNANIEHSANYFIIGSNQMLQSVYYTCLGLVPKWFPNILDGIDDTRKEAIVEICKAIGRMNNTDYHQALTNAFELLYTPEETPIDFSKIKTFLQLDFETIAQQTQDHINALQRNADNYLANYRDTMIGIQHEQRKLTALFTEPKKNEEQFIKDAQDCKSIVDYYVNEGRHIITIKSKMILDSKAIVTKILAPNNTTAQEHYNITSKRAQKLFEELWLTETLQIHFCTRFIKTKSTAVPTSIQIPRVTKNTKNTIPNPHLIHYACFGSNKQILIDAARDNNLQYYLGALTACNSNLNTGDATVLSRFCRELLNDYRNEAILYDPATKTYTTPYERMKSYETV